MAYEVILTDFAESQLDKILSHIAANFQNMQAVNNIIKDVDEAIESLEQTAGMFAPCDEPELAEYGYYRYHLRYHRYIMLYRIEGDAVYIDRMYHELQDYRHLP